LAKIKENKKIFDDAVILIRTYAEKSIPIALFGTTYAARWFSYLPDVQIAYFVDENPELLGTNIDGIAVIGIEDVPDDITVILIAPPVMSRAIRHRIQNTTKAKIIIPGSEE